MFESAKTDTESTREKLLAIITDELKHLDRTELVHGISKYPVTNASNDIYTGFYSKMIIVDNEPRSTEVKVAVKSLRRINWDKEDYVKVS